MKILHYQHNGVGVVLSQEMNLRTDTVSKTLCTARHPFGFKANYTLPPFPFIAYWLLTTTLHKHFDILHSHDGMPLPDSVLSKWKGRFVQHYHSPLAKDFYPNHTIPAFVSTPTMTTTIPNSVWIPLPVDVNKFSQGARLYNPHNQIIGFSYNVNADKSKLKHIPYDELIEFSKRFKHITLKPLNESIHHTKMPTYYRSVDIYVDRLGLDSYGWQAIEAASCGCIIVTQTKHIPQDCPFCYATRETLSNVITSIITLPTKIFTNMKHHSIEYANKYHNISSVVDRCLQYYPNLGDINAFKNSMEPIGIISV